MFDWLFEGLLAVYIFLAVLVVALFAVYWQHRRKVWLYLLLSVVALIGLYALLDRLVETDREQLQRRVNEMAADLRAHHLDAIFAQFAEDFRSPQGKDKQQLRQFADGQINNVTEVSVRNFQVEARPERNKEYDGLRFTFKVRGVGADDFPFDCVPVFAYEPTKGWQVKRLKIFKFGTTEQLDVF